MYTDSNINIGHVLVCYSNGKFMSIGEKIRLPDDVTMGYIIGKLMYKKVTQCVHI